MADAVIARLLVKIGASSSEFAKEMATATKTLERTARNMQTVGRGMSLAISAPILAAAGASLKLAMAAVESENLFTVSMGNMAGAARKWSQELSKSLGLNSYELRKSIGEWNVLLVNMGLGEQQAFGMSKSLVELSADMASFYNFTGGAAEASDKLRSIMAGEAEVARRLGIDVSAANVQASAYTLGLAKQGTTLTEQQKILARYQIVLKQTAQAQGDLARTIDSPTNQLRILGNQAQEIAIEFGKSLIPFLQAALPALKDLADIARRAAEAFAAMDPTTRKWAVSMAGLLVAIGPASFAFSKLFSTIAFGTKTIGGWVGSAAKLAKASQDAKLAAIAQSLANVDLANTSKNVTQLMRKYKVSSLEVSSAARETTTALTGTAGVLKKIGIGVGIAAAAWAGWELGKWISDITGLTEKFSTLGDAESSMVDVMVEDQSRFLDTLNQYDALREKLGLIGDEWVVAADNTRENAVRLGELMEKVRSLRPRAGRQPRRADPVQLRRRLGRGPRPAHARRAQGAGHRPRRRHPAHRRVLRGPEPEGCRGAGPSPGRGLQHPRQVGGQLRAARLGILRQGREARQGRRRVHRNQPSERVRRPPPGHLAGVQGRRQLAPARIDPHAPRRSSGSRRQGRQCPQGHHWQEPPEGHEGSQGSRRRRSTRRSIDLSNGEYWLKVNITGDPAELQRMMKQLGVTPDTSGYFGG